MTLAQTLPTKADEAWRYADLKAVESIWQAVEAHEPIVVTAGEKAVQSLILDAGEARMRRLHIVLEEDARIDLACLATAPQYGRIDIRAKLPQGQGTWSAIWMLPENNSYGSWATSGEIDILEAVNLGVACEKCPGGKENTILGTLHFGGKWPDNKLASTEVSLPGSLDEFHTYSIIWDEGRFQWLVDGKLFATKHAKDWSTTSSDDANAPFDKPFHLILNLAIGGKLPEERGIGGLSEQGFPKRMEIDFVRVWKCNAEADSDASCKGRGTD